MIINITQKEYNTYDIASINASKSLIYHAIPVIIKSLILVILPTIALIKDQIITFL